MRFIVLVKLTREHEKEVEKEIEAGNFGKNPAFAKMGAFNDTLSRDGVLLAAEGLQSTSKATRMSFSGGKATVTDGPFTESKELVAGFWILQARSKEEIIERLSHAPCERGEQLEIRQIVELEELGVKA